MARVTVEDCLDHVENRFKLVLIASKRARQIANGADPLLPWDNDRAHALASEQDEEEVLGEIAAE